MKKFLILLIALLLACGAALAEEDAITSPTLKMDRLPAVEARDNGILVVYFSPAADTVRAAAYTHAAELNAPLFEIVPEELYTEDDQN